MESKFGKVVDYTTRWPEFSVKKTHKRHFHLRKKYPLENHFEAALAKFFFPRDNITDSSGKACFISLVDAYKKSEIIKNPAEIRHY